MDQLRSIFGRLTPRQIATIAVALLLCTGALYAMVHWRKEADFKTLYTGLAAEDSAAVIQKLKESGTEYRLSESGDVISVPSAKLAEQRLQLAAAGLPRTGRIGFEIFDKTNLGATEFVEHVNYGRALEGELERSVGALSEVGGGPRSHHFPEGLGVCGIPATRQSERDDEAETGSAALATQRNGGGAPCEQRRGRSYAGCGIDSGYAGKPAQPAAAFVA